MPMGLCSVQSSSASAGLCPRWGCEEDRSSGDGEVLCCILSTKWPWVHGPKRRLMEGQRAGKPVERHSCKSAEAWVITSARTTRPVCLTVARLMVLISILPDLPVLPLWKKGPGNILLEKGKCGDAQLSARQSEAPFTICRLAFAYMLLR